MKVEDYLPYYYLFHVADRPYITGMNGQEITVVELLEQHPDFELTEGHIDILKYFDLGSLQIVLKDENWNKETVIEYLKNQIFNRYIESGGDPIEWLIFTYDSLYNNPGNYRPDLWPVLSKYLLDLIEVYTKDSELFKSIDSLPSQQTETKTEQETIELKPVLRCEAVQIVFDILKDFFSPEHQTEFRTVIETGNNASEKLFFKGHGNRLTDTFRKLIEHDFITGCNKRELSNWIISNFTFNKNNMAKAFIYDTVEKTISRNYYPCKSPLIVIENGQIQKVEQPRRRKQSKF